jgi:hypothetical protein
MGNLKSKQEIVSCIICKITYGEVAVCKLFSMSNIYNKQYICSRCYPEIKVYSELSNTKNYSKINRKHINCEWCQINIIDEDIFKIYWKGKFNEHLMCSQCFYDKDRRRYNYNLV